MKGLEYVVFASVPLIAAAVAYVIGFCRGQNSAIECRYCRNAHDKQDHDSLLSWNQK